MFRCDIWGLLDYYFWSYLGPFCINFWSNQGQVVEPQEWHPATNLLSSIALIKTQTFFIVEWNYCDYCCCKTRCGLISLTINTKTNIHTFQSKNKSKHYVFVSYNVMKPTNKIKQRAMKTDISSSIYSIIRCWSIAFLNFFRVKFIHIFQCPTLPVMYSFVICSIVLTSGAPQPFKKGLYLTLKST